LIFSQPYLKAKSLGGLLGVNSRTTLTKYFNELKKAKILFPKKDGKEVYHVNEDLVRILSSNSYKIGIEMKKTSIQTLKNYTKKAF